MQFPIQHAARSLRGKLPEELPHGLLTVPPEVRQLMEERRVNSPPEVFAKEELRMLNLETIGWYFDDLGHEVVYRETPDGPEVLAVGSDEVFVFLRARPSDEPRTYEIYAGY